MHKNKPDLVSKYVNELTVEQVENLSDAEIMGFRMERPNHKGQYGFMLTPKYFKSDEHFSEIFYALMKRLDKVANVNNGSNT